MDFDVVPPVTDAERSVLERALELVPQDGGTTEPRAASSWWRSGALEAVGSGDADVLEAERLVPSEPSHALSSRHVPPRHALSPRRTRGATRA